MTIRERNGDHAALESLWGALCDPNKASHICQFPYGQDYLTQEMYVTSGKQGLKLMEPGRNHWGDISFNFIAMQPGEVPK